MSRTRSCNNPSPSNGGLSCRGYNKYFVSCSDGDCPKVNGAWGGWSSYSTCGSNCTRSVTRSCNSPSPANGGAQCQGYSKYFYSCSDGNCGRVHGGWGCWSSYSICGSNCMRSRTRSCDSPSPAGGGSACQGYNQYFYSCTGGNCRG